MEAVVYYNWGRWVADCPDPFCSNAEEFRRGLSGSRLVCSDCRRISTVVWPDNRDDIEVVLASRSVPSTRNWIPSETVEDLINENTEHGVV